MSAVLLPRDGVTYDHGRDGARLTAQHERVKEFMRAGGWHTLAEIHEATGDPEASVSARLRDLRKKRFGKHTVLRRHLGDGLYAYRLILADFFA